MGDVVAFVRQLPTGKPLALYCYSRDSKVIDCITKRTTSGGLCINDSVMHLANHELPFGGVGRSGMGAYHGHHSFKSFTHEKAVLRKYPIIDESFLLKPLLGARFPPYTTFKKFAVKVFGARAVMLLVNPPIKQLVRFLKQLICFAVISRLLGYKLYLKRTN